MPTHVPARAKELYEKYGFLIFGRCKRILGSDDEAKDAMQEVFLKLLDNIDFFSDPEHTLRWIYTVSKNHCFNLLRDRKKFVSSVALENRATAQNLESEIESRMLIDQLLGIHNTKVREAVYYTFVEKLNQSEIREITGQSPATIRRNLAKFKKSLPHCKKRLGIE